MLHILKSALWLLGLESFTLELEYLVLLLKLKSIELTLEILSVILLVLEETINYKVFAYQLNIFINLFVLFMNVVFEFVLKIF